MQLIIVRHGQSTGNITTDDVPDGDLTPAGLRQARETAQRLAGEGITHVIASPLVRALLTATAIADASGIDQVAVWPALQEHRDTLHRGLGRKALLSRSPKALLPDSVEEDGWDHGDETHESARRRAVDALAALRARYHAAEKVVVATHWTFGCYLLRAVFHVQSPLPVWFKLNNCGVSRIDFADPPSHDPGFDYEMAEVNVVSVNDVSHLSEISQ